MNLLDMDANLQDLLAVQEGMKLVVWKVGEELGVCLLEAGDRTPLKEFSCPCRFGVTRLDQKCELKFPYSHGGFACRHYTSSRLFQSPDWMTFALAGRLFMMYTQPVSVLPSASVAWMSFRS